MSNALLSHLETCIGQPLKKVTEADFRQHMASPYAKDKIKGNAYAQSEAGDIIGLCLQSILRARVQSIRFEDFAALKTLLLIQAPLQNGVVA